MFASPILVENSLAWGNGFNRWNLPDFAGDGNGFKLGGNGVAANHTVRNSMAWDNARQRLHRQQQPGPAPIDHCTAWDNPGTGFDFDRSDSTLTENLAVANGTNVVARLQLQRLGQLLEHRRHLAADQHRPEPPSPARASPTARSRRPPSCARPTARTSEHDSDRRPPSVERSRRAVRPAASRVPGHPCGQRRRRGRRLCCR